jgi:glycosyltransferase involved in cell wall biosynthesis
MNVGIVVDNELNDDKRVMREIKILREAGYTIHALCFGFDGKDYAEPEGVNVTRISISKRLKNTLFFFMNLFPAYEWLWAQRIRNFIIADNLDIVHCHDLYMSKCTRKGISSSGRKVRMILDLHENFSYAVTTYNWTKGSLRRFFSMPGKWKKKEREYLLYADRIVVLSNEFMEDLTLRYPILRKENFCALPNLPDLRQMIEFEKKTDVKLLFTKKNQVIFYFGIVAERRGIFDTLSAFARVIKKGHKADFLIIGPVDKKDRPRFSSFITQDILKENIIYIPWIDLSELPAYLNASDICIAPFHVNPQHESGVANKIYDYMLGGKPLIVSNCRPQRKLVERFDCGIVYRDEDELVEAIISLLSDAGRRKIMGENGRNAIIDHLNMDLAKRDLIEMYRNLD